MKRTLFGVAALALAMTASAAQAQVASPVKFGVSGGLTIPMSQNQLSDAVGTGYNVSGVIGFMAPMVPVGLRADVSYNKLGEKDNSGADLGVFSGTLNGIFNLGMAPMVSPYVIAGVGIYNSKISATSGDASESKTGFGLNGGLGLKFNMSGFSTFAEARYHWVKAKDEAKGFKDYSIVPISFGIMF